MSDDTTTRDDVVSEQRYQTHDGNEVTHVTLRIVEQEDGYRVTEPGVDLDVIEQDVHDAVARYARLACGHSD